MPESICTWTPKVIVELINNLAWPIVALLIGIGFHNKISGAIRFFFSKNTVSELSASTTGVSAKFVASQRTVDPVLSVSAHATGLPEEMSVEAIKARHQFYKTEFSEEIYQRVMRHLLALNIDTEEKIELLARDISIIQSGVRYIEINKLLFRSQYNMFCTMANNAGFIRKEEAIREFESTKAAYKDAFSDWDWIKYIAYPVSNELMVEEDTGYKLTAIGRSYLSFMSKNPQMIDALAKI